MIKINGPTPRGGAYAIVYYYDNLGNRTTAEKAVVSYAQEFTSDGKLICETRFVKKSKDEITEIEKKENDNQKSIHQELMEDTIEIPVIKNTFSKD